MPCGAVLKVNVSGKVSREANYSSNNCGAASEGSCWNLDGPPEKPLKHPKSTLLIQSTLRDTFTQNTVYELQEGTACQTEIADRKWKNTFPAKY